LFDIFKNQQNVSVQALSNGVISPSVLFKMNGGVAEVLNLIIQIKNGAI
jgi:hypothetical protein